MNDNVNCGGECSLQCKVKTHLADETGDGKEAKSKFEACFFQQITILICMEFKAPMVCPVPSMLFADTAVLIQNPFRSLWWLMLANLM